MLDLHHDSLCPQSTICGGFCDCHGRVVDIALDKIRASLDAIDVAVAAILSGTDPAETAAYLSEVSARVAISRAAVLAIDSGIK